MSVSSSVHVENKTKAVGRTSADLRYTSLTIETLGVGSTTIFFPADRKEKMSEFIEECIERLTAQMHQHMAWEGEDQ